MTRLRSAYLAAMLLLVPATSSADAVLDWNEIGLTAVLAARQGAPDGARSLAMMHLAMFNAVNAIEKRYVSYGQELKAPAGASANAAAAAAAHTVLVKVLP